MAKPTDQGKRQLQGPQQRAKKRTAPPPPRTGGTGGISRKWLYIGTLGVAAAVAVALILVSVLGGDDKPDVSAIDGTATAELLSGIPQNGSTLGSPDAQVTLVEYADPQCPFCARFSNDVEPALIDQYVRDGRVAIEFRGFPFIGPDSIEATRYVYAAGLQNKLFDVLDLLYANQGGENEGWVTEELLRGVGAAVPGLDVDRWFEDARSDEVAQAVQNDLTQGQSLGVQGTPSFFVVAGGQSQPLVPSSLTVEPFQQALDEALAQ